MLLLIQIGWVQYGTPYDSPGFEQGRPMKRSDPPKAGPPPEIKDKVSEEDIDSTGKDHQKKIEEFEKE